MSNPTIEEILAPKPQARPRIYAYAIADEAHAGLLKVGQTTRDVKQRIAEQLKTAAIKNYRIELDELAERDDGSIFSDHEVRAALVKKGLENPELEWVRCSVANVRTVLAELRTGQRFTGTHHERFPMRQEQAEAVKATHAYFLSRWAEDMHAVPRFLWNAKMRFGKTFTAYQLARKLGATRVLVVTFKPAVEDAWQTDLESHVDFDGWQYLSRSTGSDPTQINRHKPVVYFGSFQDCQPKVEMSPSVQYRDVPCWRLGSGWNWGGGRLGGPDGRSPEGDWSLPRQAGGACSCGVRGRRMSLRWGRLP